MFHRSSRYFGRIVLDMIRRIAVALVSLSLLLGPGMAGVSAAPTATTMMSMGAGGMHSGGPCRHCGSSQMAMPNAACVAACGGLIAVAPDHGLKFDARPVDVFASARARDMMGRADAPDPYPPRTTSIS